MWEKWGVRLVPPSVCGSHATLPLTLGMCHLCTVNCTLRSTVADSDFLSAFARSTTLRGYKLFKRPSTDNDR